MPPQPQLLLQGGQPVQLLRPGRVPSVAPTMPGSLKVGEGGTEL